MKRALVIFAVSVILGMGLWAVAQADPGIKHTTIGALIWDLRGVPAQTPPYGTGAIITADGALLPESWMGAVALQLRHVNQNLGARINDGYTQMFWQADPESTDADVLMQVHDLGPQWKMADLNGAIDGAATTISYRNYINPPTSTFYRLNTEIVECATHNPGQLRLEGCLRGRKGSAAAAHADGVAIDALNDHHAWEVKTRDSNHAGSNYKTRLSIPYGEEIAKTLFSSMSIQVRNDLEGIWNGEPLIYLKEAQGKAGLYLDRYVSSTQAPLLEVDDNGVGAYPALQVKSGAANSAVNIWQQNASTVDPAVRLLAAPGKPGDVLVGQLNIAPWTVRWRISNQGAYYGPTGIQHYVGAVTLSSQDCGSVVTNKGATAPVVLSLPANVPTGCEYIVALMANRQVQVDPPVGSSLYVLGAEQPAGKYIEAGQINAAVRLIADGDGDWLILDLEGAWTVEP